MSATSSPIATFVQSSGLSTAGVGTEISEDLVRRVLDRFSISGRVEDIQRGPTVSVVRFRPDEITAVSKLGARARDIAFYLQAKSVRVTYDNDTGLICIEVPNQERGRVSLASLLSSSKRACSLPLRRKGR